MKVFTDMIRRGGIIIMEINSILSAQVASLQQTLQMSIMDKSLNLGATGAIEMLKDLPEQQPVTLHPYKGTIIDVSV